MHFCASTCLACFSFLNNFLAWWDFSTGNDLRSWLIKVITDRNPRILTIQTVLAPTALPSPCLLLFQLQIAFAPMSCWVSLQDHWCVGVILKLVTGSNQIPCIAVSCSTSLINSAALSWFGTHKINQALSYCLGWSVLHSIDSRPFFSFVFFTVECVNYTNTKIEFLVESDLQEQTWCIVALRRPSSSDALYC